MHTSKEEKVKKLKDQPVRCLKVRVRLRGMSSKVVRYPEIQLAGNWLLRLGFTPHDNIKVTARHRLLVIEPEEVPEWEHFETNEE